jgi:hypothetical protein
MGSKHLTPETPLLRRRLKRFDRLTAEGVIMKRPVFSLIIACAVLAVGSTARAQQLGTSLRANIPFSFVVNGELLPAGTYEIKRVADSAATLIISNLTDRRDRVMFMTDPVIGRDRNPSGELVFNQFGENYFLVQIFTPGIQTGRELIANEREGMRRQMSSHHRVSVRRVKATLY